MKKHVLRVTVMCVAFLVAAVAGCWWAGAPAKRYYLLNYVPGPLAERLSEDPWPVTVRLREFDIEEAYSRPQIVYRQSPYTMQYYFYRVWAVRPTRMVTDLLHKHLVAANLFRRVVRRFDEGPSPDYEIGGIIHALEEYDSDGIWFAHIALHLSLTRLSDGKVLMSRTFDMRKRVFQQDPEYVVREMSKVMELITVQALSEIDQAMATAVSQAGRQ